jgi:hypothetical protein
MIPIIDLVKEIRMDLEANRGYSIDKKTVRRIIEHVEAEGLVVTKEIKVTINYGNQLKADEAIDSDGYVASQHSGDSVDGNVKYRIVPIVHAPGYDVKEEDLQQYESIRNPMRIKEELVARGAEKFLKDQYPQDFRKPAN